MKPHTRSMIAAIAFARVTGKKVAGLYDHFAARDVPIAAEFRGNAVQGFDGDRGSKFGGTLPEIHDAGDAAFVTMEIDATSAKGYDRGSSTFYTATVTGGVVQVFDHGVSTWFAYDVQDADAPQSYHREAQG